MDREVIDFYSANETQPRHVRILLFNDLLNLYDINTNHFISSFPVKSVTIRREGENFAVHLSDRGYLQMHAENPLANEISRQINNAGSNVIVRLIKHPAFSLFLIAIAIIIGLYFTIISLVPYLGAKLITPETEIKIGRNLKELMIRQELAIGGSVDSTRTKELQQFVSKLKLSDRYPVRVTIITSKTINAYALPGGEIVVYSGIIDKMSSYEALVALLSHESSHINQRHTLRSLLRSTANKIFISIILGDASAVVGAIAGNIEGLNGLRYSRSLETEADEEGMNIMLANKIDLNGMKQLMEILNNEGKDAESLAFMRTHPLTTERIQKAETFMRSHNNAAHKREDLQRIFNRLLTK